eukprot:COSAG01_NODE_3808_length_5677_cov_7.172643_4_plen_55_part_00
MPAASTAGQQHHNAQKSCPPKTAFHRAVGPVAPALPDRVRGTMPVAAWLAAASE